jgi:thymidine kinase
VSELVFFSGTMDSGKSTLALQTAHNHAARGRDGLLFTRQDRAGRAVISSRLGLEQPALEVDDETDFWAEVIDRRLHGEPVDYVVADEAQFYTATQVEQLARVVDELDVDVYAFGITTDFRARLFPGSARLVELADRVEVLQVKSLCWCGAAATHQARTVDGQMVVEGAQVVVGDTVAGAKIAYEVLCRRHHMRHMTQAVARAQATEPQTLQAAVEAGPRP